jgi:arylsulfatase A-like enzyme
MAKRRPARKAAAIPQQPSTPPGASGRFRQIVPALAPIAASALLIAAVDLGLSALVSDTALRTGQLPAAARLTLAAYTAAALMTAVWVTGAVVVLLTQLRGPRVHAAIRGAAGAVVLLLVFAAALIYGTSWALFWNTGMFFDRQALAFLMLNGLQIYHWVYPPLAIAVVAAASVSALAFAWWVPRRISTIQPAAQRTLVMTAAGVLAACVAAALFGNVAYGSSTTSGDESKTDYAVSRDDRAGPVAHLIADVRRNRVLSAGAPAASTAGNPDVIRRPIVSMDQYLAGVSPPAVKHWNVVMVQVESLRSDQLRSYGGTRDVMPTIDALARESRVFTNAYIQASHSNYADLVPLASQYPLRSAQMYEYPPNPSYPRVLVYDVLKALGYKTAIFSSQNERWGGMINFHRLGSLDRFFDAETFTGPTYAPYGDTGFAEWVKETHGAGSVDDRYTMDEAIKWIDSVAGKPFFIHMNLQSSHLPYVVPDGFPRRFSPAAIDFAIMWGKFPLDKIDVVKGRYADSLYYEDTQISRLFTYLKAHGQWENTIVVIGGDNGEAFYEHGFAAHASSLFNEVVKVPMIVRAPGLEPGLDNRPAMFLDVPPSLLQLLGLPPHPGFQGISLVNTPADSDRNVYTIVQTPAAFQSAIVRSGMKLLYNEFDGKYFLYDQVNDPAEKHNLAASRPELVRDLDRRLKLWRQEQLAYYSDVPRQQREYPPVVKD